MIGGLEQVVGRSGIWLGRERVDGVVVVPRDCLVISLQPVFRCHYILWGYEYHISAWKRREVAMILKDSGVPIQ